MSLFKFKISLLHLPLMKVNSQIRRSSLDSSRVTFRVSDQPARRLVLLSSSFSWINLPFVSVHEAPVIRLLAASPKCGHINIMRPLLQHNFKLQRFYSRKKLWPSIIMIQLLMSKSQGGITHDLATVSSVVVDLYSCLIYCMNHAFRKQNLQTVWWHMD